MSQRLTEKMQYVENVLMELQRDNLGDFLTEMYRRRLEAYRARVDKFHIKKSGKSLVYLGQEEGYILRKVTPLDDGRYTCKYDHQQILLEKQEWDAFGTVYVWV